MRARAQRLCANFLGQWRRPPGKGPGWLSGGAVLDYLSTDSHDSLQDLFTLPNALALTAAVAATVAVKAVRGRQKNAAWLRGAANPRLRVYPGMAFGRSSLAALGKADEEFSIAVFEEFVRALYVQLHTARGHGELDCYRAYLTREARKGFPAVEDLIEVRDVALTGLQVAAVEGARAGADVFRVDLILQGRYTEIARDRRGLPAKKTYLAASRWTLVRRARADARTPANARDIACPECGAPLPKVPSEACEICGRAFIASWSDWGVERVLPLMREKMPPEPIDFMRSCRPAGSAQPGAELPELAVVDGVPDFDRAAFEVRVRALFAAFEEAWSVRDAAPLARLSTPGFHRQVESQLSLMRREQMQDVILDDRLERIEIVRAARDFHCDEIAARLTTACIEYVYSEREKADVLGSRTQVRRYSEYWTLVREWRPTAAPGEAAGDWKIHRIDPEALYRG